MPPVHQSTPDLPDDVVLRVNNVSKKFCLPRTVAAGLWCAGRNLRRSMWYGIRDLSRNLIGRGTKERAEGGNLKPEERAEGGNLKPECTDFRSQVSPLIPLFRPCGRTNSGLSKISPSASNAANASASAAFARLRRAKSPVSSRPTTGKSPSVAGPAPGMPRRRPCEGGFHPHMTVRENVYLNGSIPGLKREEIEAQFQGIVDFAEIGECNGAPVNAFISGMKTRL